jgi:arabinogalactan endo-1,4-beta-galactosidase
MRVRSQLLLAAGVTAVLGGSQACMISGGAAEAAAAATGAVVNPGFEAVAGQQLTSWTEHGDQDAGFVEAGGQTGANRLTHWAAGPYKVQTRQRLTGLPRGTYTLRAAVRSGGGQRAAYLSLSGCGPQPTRVDLPRTGGTDWVRLALTTKVTNGGCTIAIVSDANAGDWIHVDDVEFALSSGHEGAPVEIAGADFSHLTKNEEHGAVYRYASGGRVDPVKLMAANGVNYARFKVWVNPAGGFNDKADTLVKAKRASAAGMKLLIDFHYSDTWADPGKQYKPAAWADLPFDQLKQALYDHTYDVLSALRAQGTPADMVQVGNEINPGMLWPDGRTYSPDNWDNLAQLLKAGAAAVKASTPAAKVVLHLAEGGKNAQHRWWFDSAIARGVEFDVIGLSHYTYWHGTLGALQRNMLDLTARYGKPVMVVETAYGFTSAENDQEKNIFTAQHAASAGWPATPQGQAEALRDIFNTVAAVPGALGVFYWEPTWTAVQGAGWDPADPSSGDGWENQALFDYNGRALPALKVFKEF